jgi:hypothetical protein
MPVHKAQLLTPRKRLLQLSRSLWEKCRSNVILGIWVGFMFGLGCLSAFVSTAYDNAGKFSIAKLVFCTGSLF